MTHPHGASTGSSPLARGLRSWRPFLVFLSGIIPARAGFTDPLPRAARRPSGHPRSRGVYPRGRTAASSSSGSSPLARGLRGRGVPDRLQAGIIPARAGFTSAQRQSSQHGKDHPRSRGVYTGTVVAEGDGSGSSPLARGLRLHVQNLGEDARIIPARAGFTSRTATRKPSERIIPARAGFTTVNHQRARVRGDHPRSRGVYVAGRVRSSWRRGSSPLARGLRRDRHERGGQCGIIPARAGFTRHHRRRLGRRPDHPRSRGVYVVPVGRSHYWRGSSPLARGLPHGEDEYGREARIIPARAGFTGRAGPGRRRRRDHPRSRGVYAPHCLGRMHLLGIIPARAGFTSSTGAPSRRAADHPRSRGVYRQGRHRARDGGGSSPLARGLPQPVGERVGSLLDHPRSRGVYEPESAPSSPPCGSSPLARGLHHYRIIYRPETRIIPARAGFTRRSRPTGCTTRDHPRSRGVYMGSRSAGTGIAGSSPLARGLLGLGVRRGPGRGIIPARAGFTGRAEGRGLHHPDHPRSRGVYGPTPSARWPPRGSSPLARGLRNATCCYTHCARIIPARAGFTAARARVESSLSDHPRSRGVYVTRTTLRLPEAGSSPLARGLPRGSRPR